MNPLRRLGSEVRGWLPADAAMVAGRRTTRSVLFAAVLTAIVATGATFLITEPVVAPVPGGHGAEGSALVYGFPLPYSTSFCCMGGAGAGYGYSFGTNDSYFLNPIGLVADLGIWLAISIGCIYAFTIRKLLLSSVSGLAIALGTLLLSPLAIVAPTPAMEATLNPMGFPYAFLTHNTAGLGSVSWSGYEFSLAAAIGDSVLWAGIVMAVIGLAILGVGSRRGTPRTKPPLGTPTGTEGVEF